MAKINKHVKKFIELQANGEEVLAWAPGYIGKMMGNGDDQQKNGVLIITNSRAVFYKKGIFSETINSIALDKISAVDKKMGVIAGSVVITTSNQKIDFNALDKNQLKQCADAIEQAGSKPAADTTAATDSLDQITKLAALKDAGHITQQEFDAKKAELLDIAVL